jgi:hypothetical protein
MRDKVRYSAQAVLLVLVASGRASVEKIGRSYEYRITGWTQTTGTGPRSKPV